MEFLDINYIQDKILELEDRPAAIKKFFGGKIIDEIVNLLIEEDEKVDQKEPSDEFRKTEKCFKIIKAIILEEDLKRFFQIQSELLHCSFIFNDVIDDIEKFKDRVPQESVEILLENLLGEIPNVEDLVTCPRSLYHPQS